MEQQESKNESKIWKIVKNFADRWFIKAFSGMAQGLFCTLIAGTILAQIAGWIGDNAFGKIVNTIASVAKTSMGF